MEFTEGALIENRTRGGRRPLDHRRVLDGVLYVTRTGVPWRDLPPEFGHWNSVHRQYRRWTEAGWREKMMRSE
ncbi:MAG TPA: transposase [Beijerinckiaceae bacterium]|nr:transposase [Beijerinckiaceae bacterium]